MGSYTPNAIFDQEVHTIHIPEEVRKSGKATFDIIAEGAAFLHKDGIIVLDNAISHHSLDTLNDLLTPEALEIANNPKHHFNFGKQTRNMDQAPPPTKELMFKDIWCNPFASAILSNVLGPKPVVHYANGNTALKATPEGRQPVHSDCEFEHPAYFPFAYVVNINLVDVSPENGGTEVWPGSHHVSVHEAHHTKPSGDDGRDEEGLLTIREEFLEQRRQHSPPIQVTTRKGSLIVRDLRLWHAGRPNLTDTPRIMLAFVASPRWWRGKSKIFLPKDVKELVEEWEKDEYSMSFAAEWVDGKVDHKQLSSKGVDFSSAWPGAKQFEKELAVRPAYWPRWY
jgi:hypothetical protein